MITKTENPTKSLQEIRTCKKCGGNVYLISEERKWWCIECGLKYNVKQKIAHTNILLSKTNKAPRYTRICKNCEKQFEVTEAQIRKGDGIYCDKNCKESYQRGENAPTWMGGKSFEPYCPKFTEDIKERVRNHFDRICVYCGKTENENKRKLSVHHVNYDKGQGCTGEWLLIPLCHSCHAKTNYNRDYWETFFTEFLKDYNFDCGLNKVCPICNNDFLPENGYIKYCSDTCAKIAKKDKDEKAQWKYHVKYRKNANYLYSMLGSKPPI